ncbi:hypothetical protein [Saccharopolyspora erythraea]|uniref:hypothetical protein n=1 Tax=Saccharopolyspora erythraea TaxID=1836 RepID=UPI001E5EB798|nr:hypothetical protein [Saccharopolyspora erythraea]
MFIDAPGSLARPAALARSLEIAQKHGDVIVAEDLALDPSERTIRELIEPRGVPHRIVRTCGTRAMATPTSCG